MPAGQKLGLDGVGWHTFRHTYRSWLDATGAPLGVQQKLMRHAQISTTIDVWECADGIEAGCEQQSGPDGAAPCASAGDRGMSPQQKRPHCGLFGGFGKWVEPDGA